jgi:D-alanine-D-alanine ligase
LCEKFIPGRELTVAILDGKALPVVEIKPLNGWYDYTNKYTHGKTDYICPAELNAAETALLQNYAEQIFHRLDCRVYSRIDFRYDGGRFYFLEANTLPGMTSLSLTPMAAKSVGLELPDLLLKIIELSKNK